MKKELMIIIIIVSLLFVGCKDNIISEDKQTTRINISGYGDDVVFVELDKGLAIISTLYYGDSYFGVWLKDSDGNDLALLVNNVGDYLGTTSVKIDYTGTYLLDVSADEVWVIFIDQNKK